MRNGRKVIGEWDMLFEWQREAVFCYNNLEVNYMSNLPEDVEIHDELEAMGILKIVEENFDDWDNEEDSYYDTL